MSEGEICLADERAPDPDALMCTLPVASPQEGAELLEWVGGAATGTGRRLWQGRHMAEIRREYERLIQNLTAEVERRQAAGPSAQTIARWAVSERRRIATVMRLRSGIGTLVTFEIRDWGRFGPGGRTHSNLQKRYARQGLKGEALSNRLIRGAQSPNTGVSSAAIKGARYLKHGGRAILVISIPLTAYTLMTAPEGELERLLYTEAGAFAGGSTGAGVGTGACLIFGLATSGWGLLACGVVGGLVGGIGGSWAGEKLYYSSNPRVEDVVTASGTLGRSLHRPCGALRHRACASRRSGPPQGASISQASACSVLKLTLLRNCTRTRRAVEQPSPDPRTHSGQ